MKCNLDKRSDIIDAYIHNQLSEEEAEEFERHFFDCDQCYNDIKFRRELKHVINKEGEKLYTEYLEQRNKKTLKNKFGEWTTNFLPINYPVFAYSAVAVFICIAGYVILHSSKTGDTFPINFDKIPYAYENSGLRNMSSSSQSKEIVDFLNQYQLGMGYYLTLNYEKVVQVFDGMVPQAESLLGTEQEPETMEVIRDYYFYYGLSNLALAHSNEKPFLQNEESLNKAEKNLREANSIAKSNNFGNEDRELFFLALVFLVQGKKVQTNQILEAIPASSKFWSKSQEIIRNMR